MNDPARKMLIYIRRGMTLRAVPGSGDTLAQRISSLYCVEIVQDLPNGQTAVVRATPKTIERMKQDLEEACIVTEQAFGNALS